MKFFSAFAFEVLEDTSFWFLSFYMCRFALRCFAKATAEEYFNYLFQ